MFSIAMKDYDEFGNSATAFWVTRFLETDNYTYDEIDATIFKSKSAAAALMKTLNLDEEHFIKQMN